MCFYLLFKLKIKNKFKKNIFWNAICLESSKLILNFKKLKVIFFRIYPKIGAEVELKVTRLEEGSGNLSIHANCEQLVIS